MLLILLIVLLVLLFGGFGYHSDWAYYGAGPYGGGLTLIFLVLLVVVLVTVLGR